MKYCTAIDLQAMDKPQILDVRSQEEHNEASIDLPHILVPLDVLEPQNIMIRGDIDPSKPLYILCKAGVRAARAAAMFEAAGFDNMIVITGGLDACVQNNMPIKRQTI